MLAGDDEEDSCGVNLINEGVTVSGDCVRVQFTGCGGVEHVSMTMAVLTLYVCICMMHWYEY